MRKDLSHLPPAEPASYEFEADFEWVLAHINELTETYPDKWVAIVDKQVVAVGETIGAVEKEAFTKTNRKEFPVLFLEGQIYVYSHQLKI